MSGVPSLKTRRAPTRSFGIDFKLRIVQFGIGAHHAGQRVAVGDADGAKAEFAGRWTYSCGCEAPRRNEKLLVTPISA